MRLVPFYASELNRTEEEVTQSAKETLRHLLHHYNYFSITTIDTFFHRIVRSFSREIGLQGSFGIELDVDKVTEFVATSVYEGVENDVQLREWLVEYSMNGLRQGEGYEPGAN